MTTGLHMVNDVVYESPSVPVLLQILNGASAADLLPNGAVYSLPGNSSIEISFSSGFPVIQSTILVFVHAKLTLLPSASYASPRTHLRCSPRCWIQ